jgi:hypothetical protein
VQGKIYIENDADKWFERNTSIKHNCFTEYLIELFPKKHLKNMNLAEFGVGRANNVSLLSHFTNLIDGYDGSKKSIEMIDLLKKRASNIDGKRVNLSDSFDGLNEYDLIIYGFFTYMINDQEFDQLVENSKSLLKDKGYIFIYDFLATENKDSIDSHNSDLKVFKRNLDFYISEFKDFQLVDFRLFDNRKLNDYLDNDNIFNIDTDLDNDEYNWTFSALFKLK